MKNRATSTSVISVQARATYIISSVLPGLLLLYGLFAFFGSGQITLAATDSTVKETTRVDTMIQDEIAFSEEETPVVANDQPQAIESIAAMPILDVSQFTNISNSSSDSINPCVALGSADTPYFVWEEDGEIFFKQVAGSIANISNSPVYTSTTPAIAVDSSNTIHVVWREIFAETSEANQDAQIYYSQSTNGGLTWSSPFDVSEPYEGENGGATTDFAVTPHILITTDDIMHIVWEHREVHDNVFAFSTLLHRSQDSSSWSNISIVAEQTGNPNPKYLHDIASSGNTEVHVIWEYDGAITYKFWNGSSWESSVNLVMSNTASPTISIDAFNRVHVAWVQSDTNTINYQSKPSGSSTWSSVEVVSQVGSSSGGSPEIAASGDGDVYIAWLSDQSIVFSHKDSGGWTGPETIVAAEDAPAKHKTCQLVQDSNQNAYLAFDAQNGTQRDVFYTPVVAVGPPLAFGQDWNVECPFCSVANTQGIVHGLNTRTGNFGYQETDIALPIVGGDLSFNRSYASESRDTYTTTLGYGWVHNYDMHLQFDNTALTHTVILQAPGGSRFPYYGNGDGTYEKYAGVTAELIRVDGTNPEDTVYTVTAFDQTQAVFNADGQLIERIDPHGNTVTLTYADFNGTQRLFRATQGSRFLEYDYDSNGRLIEVSDSSTSPRTVGLGYNVNGDLAVVTNTLGLTTTYEYSGTTHLLTRIIDPSGKDIRQITYDENGRAIQVLDGNDALLADATFSDSTAQVNGNVALLANTTSSDSTVQVNGVLLTHTYSSRGTLEGVTFSCSDGSSGCGDSSSTGYNYHFNTSQTQDLNNNSPTTFNWNSNGSNLEYVQDALDNETFLTYDQYNNLTQTIDARDNATNYYYANSSFPTFLTKMTDALDKSTYYTPTTTLDGVPGLLKQQEDPDGRITTYSYNDFGQITETVVAAGTSEAVTATYGYDAIGRLTSTTQTSAGESHTSRNFYDNGNRLIAIIANWDGVLTRQNCSFANGPRDENICTLFNYDDAGRIISTTNALGQVDLTFYDGAGQVYLMVTNWDGTAYNENNPLPDLCDYANPDPEFNLCSQTVYDEYGRAYAFIDPLGRRTEHEFNGLGRISRTVTNWQDGVFNPNDPDGDIETLYEYDANGNTLIVTDTVGRMTRTFYDALNRVEGSITHWDSSTVLDDCSSLPTMRDNNICTQYEYDKVGNTIIVTDTLGRMTRTFYDELNRVEATVINWQPSLTSPDNCVLSATNDALENICTLYGYDDAGNQITTTNALNQTSLTVYDGANRPFLSVQNWDGTPISSENDCSFPPAQSDTNVCSVTYFDELGRRSSSKDALGNLTDYAYDGLGRLITTTRYLENGTVPVETAIEYDALGNLLTQTDAKGNDIAFLYDELNRMKTSTTEEGVTQTNYYNAAGWVTQTVDTLLHATTFGYDDLGRRLTVTDAESNVTTYEYDALGNQTAMIDAELVRTTYGYDGLNRLERVIENDVPGSNPTNQTDVITEYSYDALGNRVHITNALGITNTHTTYDVLNRPWIVEDALGNQTVTLYNALGYRIVMTDGNDAVTTYGYDGLNRLETINYLADGITVEYRYNALGNRTVMTDDLGTTSYDYDDLYRLTEVNDAFNATVGYSYDKVGNRTHLTYPDNSVVTYTYDMDNRLEAVLDWDTGITTYEYDLAGRLITTTLPSGVVSVNTFDDANRLTNLSQTASNGVLIANFAYELDKVGNRTTVTETIRQPGALAGVTAFLEENGQLVLEAESGTATAGTTHTWNSQTAQSDYAGSAYMRALPDIGRQYDASGTADSPGLNFTVQIDNPGSYTVWARGMAPDAAGDSLHVGVNDGTPTTAANLTGFAPNEWSWSRLTMSNTNATVDLSSSGTYTLNVWMAEDGLRLDKLMLVTDTATIPTGQGPLESSITDGLPPVGNHTIVYDYDDLYRLTDATYSGDITATYSYVYDAVGNMEAYTETVGTETSTANRYFNDANQLLVSTDTELGTTSFYYDGNGNLIQALGPNAIDQLRHYYVYNQRNLLVKFIHYRGPTIAVAQVVYEYDGNGERLRQENYGSGTLPLPLTSVITFTNDIVGMSQVLVSDDGTTTTFNLFGLDLIQQDDGSETRTLLVDGLGSARVEMVGNVIEITTTYEPYGKLLAQSGSSGTVYGYTGEQFDAATSLVYLRARYYNSKLKVFISRDPFPGWATLSASQHPYSYVGNNPINFVDPTGNISCSKLGTEPCKKDHEGNDTSEYFDYIPLLHRYQYPDLPEQPAVYQSYDNSLTEFVPGQNTFNGVKYWLGQYAYNQVGDLTPEQRTNAATISHNMFNGPRQPRLPNKSNTPDGISIFAYAPDAHIALNLSAVVGFEYLYNLHTGDKTLFFVGGGSLSFTAGAIVDTFSFNKVHNIGTNNLLYRGNFHSFSLSGAGPVGGGLGYAWTPGDPFGQSDPYSVSFIPSCGVGISANVNATEYIPLYTVDTSGFVTPHTLEYYEESRGGYVTSIVQTLDRLLTNEVQKYNE